MGILETNKQFYDNMLLNPSPLFQFVGSAGKTINDAFKAPVDAVKKEQKRLKEELEMEQVSDTSLKRQNLKQLEELDTSEPVESADDLESSNEEVLSLYDRINALEYQNKQQQTDFNRQMDEMRIKYEDQITSLSSSYQQQIAGLTAQLNNTFGRG